MKKLHPAALWAVGAALLALFSCNDPTAIGSDLLSGDVLDIHFTDSLTIRTNVLKDDSTGTYDPNSGVLPASYPVGEFLDPVFGKTTARIYAQFSLDSDDPSFNGQVLDSIVLILPWQAAHTYGKLSETYKLELRELDESLDEDSTYFSTDSFAVKPGIIGMLEFTPNPEDSVTVLVPDTGAVKTEKLPAHLRIPLAQFYAEQFFTADSATNFVHDTAFHQFFKGVEISAAGQNGGMLSFHLHSGMAGLKAYFHKGDKFSSYTFPIFATNVVTAAFRHDYAGSIAENFIGSQGEKSDSLVFLQGMSGLDFVVEIPYADKLKNVIVNRAELEFTIVRLPEDDLDYEGVDQIVVFEMVDDTTLRQVPDVTIAILKAVQFYNYFGGNLEDGTTYKLNISSHFQDMIAGTASKKLLVQVYQKPEKTERVVLGGPSSFASPMKLNLSFTKY